MKSFTLANTEDQGKMIIHLLDDSSNYTITYDHGSLIYTNDKRSYTINNGKGDDIIFKNPDRATTKKKYLVENLRALYKDITPTDFGINDILDVTPGSSHFTQEITIGGINDYITVTAPESVTIYVNNNVVSSGSQISTGDVIKFELTAPTTQGQSETISLSVGDVTKTFDIRAKALVINEGDIYLDFESGLDTNAGTLESPVKSLNKATQLVQSGGVISVIPKHYIFAATDYTTIGNYKYFNYSAQTGKTFTLDGNNSMFEFEETPVFLFGLVSTNITMTMRNMNVFGFGTILQTGYHTGNYNDTAGSSFTVESTVNTMTTGHLIYCNSSVTHNLTDVTYYKNPGSSNPHVAYMNQGSVSGTVRTNATTIEPNYEGVLAGQRTTIPLITKEAFFTNAGY